MLAVRPSLTSAGVLIGTGERVSPGLGCSDGSGCLVGWVAEPVADGSVDSSGGVAAGLPGSASVVLEEPGLVTVPPAGAGASPPVICTTTMITMMISATAAATRAITRPLGRRRGAVVARLTVRLSQAPLIRHDVPLTVWAPEDEPSA